MPLMQRFFRFLGLDRKIIKHLRVRNIRHARARQTRDELRDATSSDMVRMSRFFYFFVALSVVVVVWHCGFTRAAAAPLLWAFACASVGAAFGFLFGIPKILQSGTTTSDAKGDQKSDYRQQVNTNLTEISDWLTKIIVGLGLINLSSIPVRLNNAAMALSGSVNPVDPNSHKAFALALIVCYLIVGFLFGYLSTRLVLQAAFSRADQAAAAEAQVAIISRLTAFETKQDFILAKGSTRADGNGESGDGKVDAHGGVSVGVGTDTPSPVNTDGVSLLTTKANAYLGITAESLSERIRLKNQAATDMLNFIMTHGIKKEIVFSEADRSGNEGMILALANYVLTYPQKNDVDYLLRLANRASRLHVKYRIVQALGELFDKNCATRFDAPSVQGVLDGYEKSADPSLLALIRGTRTRINRATNQEQVSANSSTSQF